MAYELDSNQPFTINLTALLEGKGIITYMWVGNFTQEIDYEWFDGAWQTPLPQAAEGDSLKINIDVLNDGDTADTLFAEFVSADVTPAEATLQELEPDPVAVGGTGAIPINWTFTMPPNDVAITIGAGHVE